MQLTLQAVLSVFTAVLTIGIAAFAWQYRETDGVLELVVFNVGIFVWTAGNAAQHAAVTLDGKLFWVHVQYFGLVLVPVAVYAFACQFTGRKTWSRGWPLAAVAAPLALLLVLSLTNPWHELVRVIDDIELLERSGVLVDSYVQMDRTEAWGPAFWVGWLYSQAVLVVATILLLGKVFYGQQIFKRQALAIVLGSTVPWIGHMLFIAGLTRIEPVIFFGVTGVAFVYAVLRYQLLDLVPVARDAVLELMHDGVIVVDAGGRIVDVNEAATEILDTDASKLVGQDVAVAFADHPAILACYEHGETTEDLVVELAGTRRDYDVQSSAIDLGPDDDGTILLLHDITLIRQREQELERQNEQLEIVAETISHDLRNPLNVASGFLQQARDTGEDGAFDRVERAHGRMEEIIEDVLALARHDEDITVQPCSLAAAAREAWDHVETAGATLTITGDTQIEADHSQLLTLLENMYRNSVEHGGPDVTVRVGPSPGGFFVADDGPGIPPEEREQVFEHGYSKGSGTGFGLAIVERVATAHGWEVSVTESENGGARFEVAGVVRLEPQPIAHD